jgi:hypothetical protein
VKANGFTNGTITVRAKAGDESGVFSDITFTVTNQAVSVNNPDAAFIQTYPNPVTDMMYIDLGNQESGANIKIRNLLGTLVFEKTCFEVKPVLNLNSLQSGIYFIEITFTKGSQIIRFIKQ